MNVSFTLEEGSATLIVATVIAVMTWYSAGMTGIPRITSAVISWLIAAVVMVVGLWLLN